ncbi:MAG: hypothetical protein GY811_14770 [Myxococcales bacterium]|nr:hypothetical protein [Myxococcales bacterium]
MNLLLEDEGETSAAVVPTVSQRSMLPVALLLDDARASERVARILLATTDSTSVRAHSLPSLEEFNSPETIAICTGETLEGVLAVSQARHIIVCDRSTDSAVAELCLTNSRINHVVGWCGFESVPRPWELAMSVRSTSAEVQGTIADTVFARRCLRRRWMPRSPGERDRVCDAIRDEVTHLGVARRGVESLVDAAYELMMNALYDAPTDAAGNYCFAHDRGANIQLEDAQRPVVQFVTDGVLAAVEVTDPFGSLQRHRFFESISRRSNSHRGVLDRSHGGAGLGLQRVYANSIALAADVVAGRRTSVTAIASFDLSARQCLDAPTSLHYRGPRG